LAQYLNEIRLGKQKRVFRDVIADVRNEFNLRSNNRPVPHITLFGPYDAKQGFAVKKRTQAVLQDYSIVPFAVRGFDCFAETNVVYADVEPSQELRSLRRDLANSLEPVTYNHRSWDLCDSYEFHITIATNLGDQTSSVLAYVKNEYELDMELHATRLTAVDRGRIMWEWDLPRETELSSQEATSKESWEKTMRELERQQKQTNARLLDKILSWLPLKK